MNFVLILNISDIYLLLLNPQRTCLWRRNLWLWILNFCLFSSNRKLFFLLTGFSIFINCRLRRFTLISYFKVVTLFHWIHICILILKLSLLILRSSANLYLLLNFILQYFNCLFFYLCRFNFFYLSHFL
jgi:hypothetical protein